MKSFNVSRRFTIAQLFAILLSLLIPVSTARAEQQHVLPIQELHESAVRAADARTRNLAQLDHLFANDTVKNVMKDQHLDATQVRKAMAVLSDEDISRLAEKARTLESDLAAGGAELSNSQVTLFVLGFFLIIFLAILVLAFQ